MPETFAGPVIHAKRMYLHVLDTTNKSSFCQEQPVSTLIAYPRRRFGDCSENRDRSRSYQANDPHRNQLISR